MRFNPGDNTCVDYAQWQLDLDQKCRRRAILDADIRGKRLKSLHQLSKTAHGKHLYEQFVDAVRVSLVETCSLALAPWYGGKGRAGPNYAAVDCQPPDQWSVPSGGSEPHPPQWLLLERRDSASWDQCGYE